MKNKGNTQETQKKTYEKHRRHMKNIGKHWKTNEKHRKTHENKGKPRKTEGINSERLVSHGVVGNMNCPSESRRDSKEIQRNISGK